MYRGFNIENFDFEDRDSMSSNYSIRHFKDNKSIQQTFVTPIESYLTKGMNFDGESIRQGWFPSENKFDLFISHSRDDKSLAFALAYWIEENFSLSCFVDALVWSHYESLQKKLDEFYTKKYKSTYNEKFRNRVYQHIDLMLNTSLMEVMDRCECFFFLNTPLSVDVSEIGDYLTDSPWLFSEIGMFNSIQKKRQRVVLNEAQESTACFSKIQYKLNLGGLKILDADDLNNWTNIVERNKRSRLKKHPLDVLYYYCSGRTK